MAKQTSNRVVPHAELYKEVILGTIGAGLSLVSWVLLQQVFRASLHESSQPGLTVGWIIATVCLFLFLFSIIVIDAVTIPRYRVIFFLTLVNALFVFAGFGITLYSLAGLAVMIISFALLTEGIRQEAKNQIHVRVFQSSENGLRTAVLLFTVALSFLYFGVISTLPGGTQKVLDDIGRATGSAVNAIFRIQLPGYDPNLTLDEYLLKAPENFGAFLETPEGEIPQQAPQDLLDALPQEMRSQIPPELLNGGDPESLQKQIQTIQIKAFREAFNERLGIQATGDDLLSDVSLQIAQSQINRLLGPYQKYLPPIMALSLFFLLGLFTPFFRLLIRMISSALFFFLVRIRFIRIQDESEHIEVPTL
jgi:hypothetical protein